MIFSLWSLEGFVKYLGTTIDTRLNFDGHISTSTRKVSRSFGVIIKFKQILLQKLSQSIDVLQLHRSFLPPKRLDVKTPLQSIGRYCKSMFISFSGHV